MYSPYRWKQKIILNIIKKYPEYRKEDKRLLTLGALLAVHQIGWMQMHLRTGLNKRLCKHLSRLGQKQRERERLAIEKYMVK